jgi:hypothetical protein
VKHTNDRRLTMGDLFCCTGAIAGQVPEAGSESGNCVRSRNTDTGIGGR